MLGVALLETILIYWRNCPRSSHSAGTRQCRTRFATSRWRCWPRLTGTTSAVTSSTFTWTPSWPPQPPCVSTPRPRWPTTWRTETAAASWSWSSRRSRGWTWWWGHGPLRPRRRSPTAPVTAVWPSLSRPGRSSGPSGRTDRRTGDSSTALSLALVLKTVICCYKSPRNTNKTKHSLNLFFLSLRDCFNQ